MAISIAFVDNFLFLADWPLIITGASSAYQIRKDDPGVKQDFLEV